MSITLCMVVRDEAADLEECLKSVLPYVDEVLIGDTGSTDQTPDIIRAMCSVEPIAIELHPDNCYSLTPARNSVYERVKTDWILYLDADERLTRSGGSALRRAIQNAIGDVGGFFGSWNTLGADGSSFEDYKLFMFRRGLRKRGLAHANVQLDLRQKGQVAQWLDGLQVDHRPRTDRLPAKRSLYRNRLQRAIELEPGWLRHNWFAGYMDYQDEFFDNAIRHIQPLIVSCSRLFPVEGLNARMIFIDMLARCGNNEEANAAVQEALAFYETVRHDFEVLINFRMHSWLLEAEQKLLEGTGASIRAYAFSS